MPAHARPFAAACPSSAPGWPAVVGCDEVGRGALAGPVVVAAVWFDPAAWPAALLARLDDSKRLAAAERAALAPLIRAHARMRLAARGAAAIDRTDIRQATLAAMADAVRRLGLAAPVLVDGRDLPPGVAGTAVVGGDALVPQIAAASIVAKVARDRLMAALGARHPAYGWAGNAGYGTAAHRAAIRAHGATRHHRRTFGALLRAG